MTPTPADTAGARAPPSPPRILSEARFIGRFREATERTPGRYARDCRLRRAAELLLATDRSIEQIAESCGFANR